MNNSVFLTVISGVSVYVLGQIAQNFFLKPIQDLKVIIGEISNRVKYYANITTNSGLRDELVKEASENMRNLSCRLESGYVIIPFKDLLSFLRIIPCRKEIREATTDLIYLANAGGRSGNEIKCSETIDKIKKALNIEL